jgi:O-antigen/teichoic acid export membrane protein
MSHSMSIVRRIFSNAIYLSIADVIGKFSLFILSIYMARLYGSEIFGQYSLIISLITIFSFIPDFGISALITRDVARNNKLVAKHIINGFFLRGLLSLLSIVLLVVFVNIFHYSDIVKVSVYLASITLFFSSITQLCKSIFRAFEKMIYEAIILVIEKVLFVVLGLWIVFAKESIIYLFIVFVVSSFLALVFSLFVLFWKFANISRIRRKIDFSFVKRIMSIGKYFTISSILGIILFRIDTVMLSIMKGDSPVGWYNAAYNLILGISFIPGFFSISVFPLFARLKIRSEAFAKAFTLSVKYLTALAIPLAVGTTVLAGRIILLFYGGGYENSILTLKLLIWAEAITFIVSIVSIILFAVNKEKIYSVVTLSALIVNIVLNLFFIPSLSMVGASIATIISNIFLLVGFWYFVYKEGLVMQSFMFIFHIIISSLVMLGVLFLVKDLNLFLIICVSVFAYLISLFVVGFFSKGDIKLFKEILRLRV